MMNEHVLSQRLARVGAYVPAGARLADIGSDHAYLPVALMLQGKISYAIAGEVVKGPYESALAQVRKSGLTQQIDVRLADGLEAVQLADELDAITIAGMGGVLITAILAKGQQQGRLSGKERLILQPNVGEPAVRQWLVEHDYQIIAEEILAENGKRYEIIVGEKSATPMRLTPKERFFGPFLMAEKNAVFLEKWQFEQGNLQRVLQQLQQAKVVPTAKVAELQQQLAWIQEVLA